WPRAAAVRSRSSTASWPRSRRSRVRRWSSREQAPFRPDSPRLPPLPRPQWPLALAPAGEQWPSGGGLGRIVHQSRGMPARHRGGPRRRGRRGSERVSINLRVQVDADNMLGRKFSELERRNLGFAVVQACNATAFEIREIWKRTAPRVFDRPTAMTLNAAQYRKATRTRPYAEIYLRDEAHKGTPPAKYLFPQVEGGERRHKGVERLLQSKGAMPAGMFAVAGKGAELDSHGN